MINTGMFCFRKRNRPTQFLTEYKVSDNSFIFEVAKIGER